MELFPKKYKVQDLHNRAKKYKAIQLNNADFTNNEIVFSVDYLPISMKLSYRDFFMIYMRDFANCYEDIKNRNFPQNNWNHIFQQLFLADSNQLQNISSCYTFFNKKNQSLPKVGINKLERYLTSFTKKIFNANNKILESYLSSSHKIFVSDSEMYLYILQQLRSLWGQWKIINKTKIWYRSFNLQTSIPLENITRKEERVPCYVLKYFVWAKCEALPVCVQDIDLCCWDVALLVHPKDKRYNKYIWKNAIIPLCNRQIPIIWDDNVNIAVDNWIKRVCPCADQESIALAEKYWLPTNIFVFNQEWLYTEYIHESVFVWQERNKYYNNIVWFIEDIWNLSEKSSTISKIPYLDEINERLVPYQIEQFVIDVKEEKQKIINQILNGDLCFSFLDDSFWNIFNAIRNGDSIDDDITNCDDNLDDIEDLDNENIDPENDNIESDDTDEILAEDPSGNIIDIKQQIINEIDTYLPDSIISNSQLPFWRRLPILKNNGSEYSFFDIEKMCLEKKEKPMQLCFNFTLLSLVLAWVLWIKNFWNDKKENRLCDYHKLFNTFSENEQKILYFVQYLSKITWEKSEYADFLWIIRDLSEENNHSTNALLKLIDNCKFITKEWDWIFLNINWIMSDIISPDLIQLCIPCYLESKGIKINNQVISTNKQRSINFEGLLVQELLLWHTIYKDFFEESYIEDDEFLWDKQLTKSQIEQRQWDLFSIYWENPIRLNFLINKTFNQKEILLNNIFLKQIWNATRLCIQKEFLPEDIERCLSEQPNECDDFDIIVLDKLKDLYNEWQTVKTYKDYMDFFSNFKESMQNMFFSRYLEIQKIHPTKNVQFVSAYFFNFLLSVLYPLTPEFVYALQYVSQRNFIQPINSLELERTTNYDMNILYNTFIKIKQIKIECNIRQHESCNLFIKSMPTIWDIFAENEQIFKNYFHISEISYLRLHEPNPLWYEVFSDESITIGIQRWYSESVNEIDSIDTLERDIKNLDDKLNLIRQRLQILPEWEQRSRAEEEYAKTKEEIENLTIKYSLLSSK